MISVSSDLPATDWYPPYIQSAVLVFQSITITGSSECFAFVSALSLVKMFIQLISVYFYSHTDRSII